ncbi:hypothetical protein [Halarcobacter ebronensis]|uniref:PsbP C-terminal domain-containing protein n=1 Tax=Halarcobacter ebronensis TaxID=1462615 RepID=A0A4Q1AK16_9BACT|nr:hypothetical protein [Halarcobacter ebronensis]QKF81320.1 hypothetical protein AEBR_0821 [Halarcobacter ebronensis]RXK04885.1 hypothetical protein CRV07_09860 [Halarcobacter ebronensis]
MKNIKKSLFLTLISTVIFSGCASWQNVTGIQKLNTQKLTLDLKDEKWHALKIDTSELYILTKDGTALQDIDIRSNSLDDALKFSKVKIPKDILNHELAQLIIEDLKVANEMNSFKILNNSPEKIDTKDGVKIIYQFNDQYNNIIKRNATYFIYDEKLYSINYIAPNQYYYDRDLEEYNRIKESIKLDL